MNRDGDYQRSSRKSLNIGQMQDVHLEASVMLGEKMVSIREILNMSPGYVIRLDRVAGENVDLVINGRLIARGEVVITNNRIGFRLVALMSQDEKLKRL
jgi:flagellar motor switch protein FliN/FliY